MERVKVALLAAVALGLWMGVIRDWMPEAHAQPAAPVKCEAWYADISNSVAAERAVDRAREYVGPVAAWIEQNPGEPVFRTTLVRTNPMSAVPAGYIDVLCVR